MKILCTFAVLSLVLLGCAPKPPDAPKEDAAEKISKGEKVNPSDITPK